VNLVLIEPTELEAGAEANEFRATLYGRRARHLREVLRAQPGRTLRAGVVGGPIGTARVVEAGGSRAANEDPGAEVTLHLSLGAPPPPALSLRLVLALPRPKVLARLLVDAAAAGVKAIDLIGAWRVEKSYWHSPVLTDERMREHLIVGLEQGGDTVLPLVRSHRLFKPFVEDILPVTAAGTTMLLADPRASMPCPYGVEGVITLIVGPDRGFTEYENRKLVEAGARGVSLGPRPLRV